MLVFLVIVPIPLDENTQLQVKMLQSKPLLE